jgi:hypothetical protein
MPVIVLILVVAVIAFLLYQSVQDAKRRAEGGEAPEPRAARRPQPKPRPAKPKPRPRKVKVDEQALAEHVAKLRDAIEHDLISIDEAVASVVRQTDGAVGEDAARKLLQQGGGPA